MEINIETTINSIFGDPVYGNDCRVIKRNFGFKNILAIILISISARIGYYFGKKLK
tara:strand:- start:611 stop:778 length:168 start_codon:yes stop_codon:yes gene_type:complete